jgi:hypothetical protein
MTVMDLPTLLDSKEAAAKLRMHPLTLLRKARQDPPLIGSIRSGGRVFFTPEHIETYLADCETRATEKRVPKPSRNPRYSK